MQEGLYGGGGGTPWWWNTVVLGGGIQPGDLIYKGAMMFFIEKIEAIAEADMWAGGALLR